MHLDRLLQLALCSKYLKGSSEFFLKFTVVQYAFLVDKKMVFDVR
jgi:hypothetical protein